MPAETAELTLPPAVPKPAERQAELEQQPSAAAPVPTAPPAVEAPAPQPAAPAAGSNARTVAQIASWQRLLVNHLQRFKRYPPQAKGEQGVTSLAFRLDRRGRLLSSRIIRSSGSPILDRETLALIKRAETRFPSHPRASTTISCRLWCRSGMRSLVRAEAGPALGRDDSRQPRAASWLRMPSTISGGVGPMSTVMGFSSAVGSSRAAN
jgi:TonB family protein